MNKSFINRQNGIKPSGINKFIWIGLLFFLSCLSFFVQSNDVLAAENLTYTQNFQNETTTLSGKSVQSNMYFTKMDYWDIKKATFNLNFQISQLSSRQVSDITVSINGVKFDSFRPKDETGAQSQQIEIPLNLLSGTNKLQINGQILNQTSDKDYQLQQTPANWLTINQGSNVNFEYSLKPAENTLHSFYHHFSGQDTVSFQHSKIVTSDNPSADELTASMIALSGESRVISTDNDQVHVVRMNNSHPKKDDYLMVVAKYNKLPDNLKKQINSNEIHNQAIIKTFYTNNRYYLIVTAQTGSLLKKAARFVANEELMNETDKASEMVDANTDTFTSSLHDNGHYQLTSSEDNVQGAGHQETSYFITLPNDHTNIDDSLLKLKFRYSKNLNFNRALATVYINKTIVGSKKLSAAKADGDTMTVNVPRGIALGNSFQVRVAFDLEMLDQNTSDNSNTPWAQIEPKSSIYVKSERGNDLLFSNYPTLFINNQTYDNLAVVIPKTLSNYDFKTLTNIFNLIGNFSKSNTGKIQFYTAKPNKNVLRNSNVIVVGTPKNNDMIKTLNSKLYFRYSKGFNRIVSNEKLSIERDYGKTIGTDQLLRSPYNEKKGLLVVTGPSPKATYLASTQINFQKNIQQYNGDAIIVDPNNAHYNYRFKKNKAIDKSLNTKNFISRNSQLLIYLGFSIVVLILIGVGIFLTLRKQSINNGGNKNGK